MSKNPPVIHKNVALMLCDSPAVLTETLHQLETEDIPFRRLGDRGFVAPAYYVEQIRKRLKEKTIYPAIIGDVVTVRHYNELEHEGSFQALEDQEETSESTIDDEEEL